MQVCLRRYGVQRALSEHWPGSAAGLWAREDADTVGEGRAVEDDIIFVGSQGALLGAVEVRYFLHCPSSSAPAQLPACGACGACPLLAKSSHLEACMQSGCIFSCTALLRAALRTCLRAGRALCWPQAATLEPACSRGVISHALPFSKQRRAHACVRGIASAGHGQPLWRPHAAVVA